MLQGSNVGYGENTDFLGSCCAAAVGKLAHRPNVIRNLWNMFVFMLLLLNTTTALLPIRVGKPCASVNHRLTTRYTKFKRKTFKTSLTYSLNLNRFREGQNDILQAPVQIVESPKN